MKKESMAKIVTRICYGILFFFMFTIVLRLFTRFVLVKGLGMENNIFVKKVFFDQPQLVKKREVEKVKVEIAWKNQYPFPSESIEKQSPFAEVEKINSKISSLETSINAMTNKLSVFATDFLIGQKHFVTGMNRVEHMIGWNIANYAEYNAVVTLEDGRLAEYSSKKDVTENVKSIINLKEFCDESGFEFFYIQNPAAICKEEDSKISGILDFSNQNADDLLERLQSSGVECLDMRQCLHEDGLSHVDAFFRTDHHWKPETGLWAAGSIAEYLNKEHGFSIDCSMLEEGKFTYVVYPSWWLGSRGKKLTVDLVEPEDFTMIYPKYETSLHYTILELGIDETGDFTTTYDMGCVATTEGYSANNSYAVYNYGDVAVNILQNLKNTNNEGKKILIIKDSFMETVIPFLACVEGICEIDVLDMRHFTGSTKAFIKEKSPDIVIVCYSPGAISSEVDYESHTSFFDFR